MALAQISSATLAALVIGTETSIDFNATSKTFVLLLDTSPMLNGDIIEVRAFLGVLAGDTTRALSDQVYIATYAHLQGNGNPPLNARYVTRRS